MHIKYEAGWGMGLLVFMIMPVIIVTGLLLMGCGKKGILKDQVTIKRNTNMNQKIINIFIIGSFLLAFGASTGCIENTNGASYGSDCLNLGKIDLDDIIKNANNAGYSVEHKVTYSGGIQPVSSIEGLNEKIGNDYKITTVHYNYDDIGLALSLNEMPQRENSATLTFRGSNDFPLNKEVPDDWITEMLMISFDMNRQDAENYVASLKNELKLENKEVPDDWITEMLMISFDMNRQDAENYVASLKNKLKLENKQNDEPVMVLIENGDTIESKIGNAKVWISEKPDINSIYYYLGDKSTNSSIYFNYPGSCGEDFFNGETKICSVYYTLPLITVTRISGEHTYRLDIDDNGIVSITVKLNEMEKEIPESEYKAVLKEMFVDLGLNPEQVDDFEFNYDPYH